MQNHTNHLLPCLPGQLIIEQQAADLVQSIRSLISATDEVYNVLYLNTLYRFAEFCQSMPFDVGAAPYTLLKNQLALSMAALKIRRGMLLPKGAGSETIMQQEPQWTYAVFTAALCYQLEKLTKDTAGLMQIIPAQCLHWLKQNSLLFDEWWHAITANTPNSILTIIIQAVKALQLKANAEHDLAKTDTTQNAQTNLPEIINTSSDLLTPLLAYLTAKYSEKNTDLVCLKLPQGLLINSHLISDYVTQHNAAHSIDDFIANMSAYLVPIQNHYRLQYRPKDFEDKRIIEGILLKAECLTDVWQAIPVNTDFILFNKW